MPCIAPISTKQARRGLVSTLGLFLGFGLALSALPLIAAENAPVDRPTGNPIEAALDHLYRMDYPAAEESILKGLPKESPARAYFAATVCINRF